MDLKQSSLNIMDSLLRNTHFQNQKFWLQLGLNLQNGKNLNCPLILGIIKMKIKFVDWYMKIGAAAAIVGGCMELFMITTGFCMMRLLSFIFSVFIFMLCNYYFPMYITAKFYLFYLGHGNTAKSLFHCWR